MTDTNPSLTTKTVSATALVAGLLPQIAGAVAGASALGLLAGWREVSAYYSELGAPWVSGMLSPGYLIARSAALMVTIGIFTWLSVWGLSSEYLTEKGLRSAAIVALFLAAPFLVLTGVAPAHWFEQSTIYIFAIAGAQLTAVSVGLTVGELIAGLAERDLKWQGYHVWLLYCIVSFGLLQAPDRLGRAKAQLDGVPTSTSLPIVSTTAAVSGRVWRLVATIDNSFLAVALGAKREEHVFRVFAASEIIDIRSSHSKNLP